MANVVLPFVRSAYNYDRDAVSHETGLTCLDDSLAVQSAKEESDINTIVRRFGLTGELPGDFQMPQSGDFTGLPDFHTSMNMVRAAQEEFLRMPADMRARFANDPQQLMNFLDNADNRDEAIRLGLIPKPVPPVVPQPIDVRVVTPTPPAGNPAGGTTS